MEFIYLLIYVFIYFALNPAFCASSLAQEAAPVLERRLYLCSRVTVVAMPTLASRRFMEQHAIFRS